MAESPAFATKLIEIRPDSILFIESFEHDDNRTIKNINEIFLSMWVRIHLRFIRDLDGFITCRMLVVRDIKNLK